MKPVTLVATWLAMTFAVAALAQIEHVNLPLHAAPLARAGNPQPGLGNGVGYSRILDPLERSFTVDAPAGWHSEAGLARFGLIQINPYVRALSPDKTTYLMLGEPSLTGYAPPNPMMAQIGFKEGKLYSPGLGQRVVIMHYIPGAEFAKAYGQTALGSLCPGLKFVSTTDRPEVARRVEAEDRGVIPSRYDAGDAAFTCTHNHREMEAWVEAATTVWHNNLGWGVVRLQAFIAPQGQGMAARAALAHMIGSFQWDQSWQQKQNELTRMANEAIEQRIQQQERQQAAFLQKFNAVDKSFDEFDELINGVSAYRDDSTGQEYSINNSNPNKWINDGGRVVGTPTNNPPVWGGNWRPLKHLYK